MTDEQPLQSVSKAEAARRLNVSVRTLERLLQAGGLEGVRDGPQGGLRPTRASVERRLEQLGASTSAPNVQPEPVPVESPPLETSGDGTEAVPPAEVVPAAVSGTVPPQRRARLLRNTGRAGPRMLRRGRREAMRVLRSVAKRPARAARCVIAAALIAGLIALGATRERPGAAPSRGDVTLLVITAREDGQARHRTRLRCRAAGAEPVKVYVRRGRLARCASARGRRAAE